MKALGEAAVHLPWLSPCAASLLALTRAPTAAVWDEVRQDPGCVLLLIRHAPPAAAVSGLSLFPGLLRDGAVLDAARSYLETKPDNRSNLPGFVDWNQPALRSVYLSSLAYAHLAHRLAEHTDQCPADNAWVGGLLAPLGCLAAAAADPARSAALFGAGRLPGASALDVAAVARRLARRWKLPLWLTAVVGHLGLPLPVAQGLGADPESFRIVQLAVGLVEKQGFGLGLALGTPGAALLETLGLGIREADSWCAEIIGQLKQTALPLAWAPPASVPLLPDLLRLAAENRRLADLPTLARVQDDVDVLHTALEEQHRSEAHRLRTEKLAALAEFAAGAGHEINNPLAVISGQAQYLLKRLRMADSGLRIEEDVPASPNSEARGTPDSSRHPQSTIRTSLEAIIAQTHRIHHILTDLMQFARPAAPQKQLVDVALLIQDTATTLQGLASERKVRLVCPAPSAPLTLYADASQLSRALICLLRNAIEAAPTDGWAGVRAEVAPSSQLDLIVEDNGRGPLPAEYEHMFDPFFSGRQAGRGRGLGLPTAWRLAQQQGGEVRFAGAEQGQTRFILSLPLSPEERNGHVDCAVPSAA